MWYQISMILGIDPEIVEIEKAVALTIRNREVAAFFTKKYLKM